ncbi:J domain-containing protein [Sphingomonas sp. URHD0057]|uniref:J domain-containing protein n=1 Tax=Sphingomonas sp. URHD0057 TaxID=1380389 RepID=UPI0006880222|nr:J domain-containing protein [Sphingomonas sp. URHD0057]
MAGRPSAYAALGLEPGADSAAIDQAYKDLIKRYHPDRAGGDADRAAEIIQAYRQLRGSAARDALEFNEFEGLAAKPWFTRAALPIAAAGAILILVLTTGPVSRLKGVPSLPLGKVSRERPSDPMEQPLALAAVDRGVEDALRLNHSSDEMALASATRDCHHQLRLRPSLGQLDRCAAFDDAVVVLQDRDPLRDQGPFSELAVTGRQWSGAQTLSNDNLAIDGRLDRIRLRVELALAPAVPPSPPPEAD